MELLKEFFSKICLELYWKEDRHMKFFVFSSCHPELMVVLHLSSSILLYLKKHNQVRFGLPN